MTGHECAWCHQVTTALVLVQVLEQGSGGGGGGYACHPCVTRHRIIPVSELTEVPIDGRVQYRTGGAE